MPKRLSASVLGRFFLAAACIGALAGPAYSQTELDTEEKQISYAIGYSFGASVAQQLQSMDLNDDDMKIVAEAMTDALLKSEPKTDLKLAMEAFQRRQIEAQKAAIAERQEANKGVLEKEAGAEGATKTDSGLIVLHEKVGDGASPTEEDTVRVHYRGTLAEGAEFDSSYKRGEPAVFGLKNLIPCMREGISLMNVGGKSRIVCPPEIAYGPGGAGESIPPYSVLVFEVELLEIQATE